MKHLLITNLVCLLATVFTSKTLAQEKPVQIALFNPIQIFDESTSITGLRISFLYGKNATLTGLDWGLVNHLTSGVTKGVQFGLVGIVESDFTGWQNNGFNITHKNFEGLQWGVVNYAGSVSGVQIGLVNYAANMKKGLQIGLVNIIKQGGQFPVFPIVNWAL